MNWLKKESANPYLNLLWAPILTLLVNYALCGAAYFSQLQLFAGATAVALPLFLLLSKVQMQLSFFLRNKYPGFGQRKARFAAWTGVSLPLTLFLTIALWWLFSYLPSFAADVQNSGLVIALIFATVLQLMAIIVNEGLFTYNQWKEAIIEAERLQKVNLESRYEGLKQQVNPHFLFNSINTLSSLIYEDKKEAGRYVKEMSQVYRYLLRNNDDELVPLQTELKFLSSYFHLLKTRFGSAIHLQVELPEKIKTCLLPPLTLQMLVENAVKHNNVSKTAPLTVTLESSVDGWLTVKNNLQPKQGKVDSTGIGLANIREKYKLLGLPDVTLLADLKNFVVNIPLVEQHVRRSVEN